MIKLLTMRQAVEESGIPYDALLRALHQEGLLVKLPGRKKGYFVDPADLEALIQRSKENAGETTPELGTSVGTKTRSQGGKIAPQQGTKKWDKGWHEKYLQ